MDWADSPELMEIYLAEIDERSARLVAAGRELARGALAPSSLDPVIRDAHTLKGSANMIGQSEVGSAAAALERAWKRVDRDGPDQSEELGGLLADLASALPTAARDKGDIGTARPLVSRLSAWTGEPAAPPSPPSPTLEVAEVFDSTDDAEPHEQDASFGGLLGTVQEDLTGEVMRVDTSGLYRLINRTVEIGLEADALSDLTHVSFEDADPERVLAAWRGQLARLSAEVRDLRDNAVALANVRFGEAVETFPQFVRFLSRRLGKDVELNVVGETLAVDRQIVDLLREPLRHLVVNAMDHGIETPAERVAAGKPATARLSVEAEIREMRLLVSVADDGRGIDWSAVEQTAAEHRLGTAPSELAALLLKPGFSTVSEPNDFSGTGEGLALVSDVIDRVGGAVSVSSQPGQGTEVRLDLPVSLVLQDVVIIACGDQFFGLAESAVVGTPTLKTASVGFGERGRELDWRGEPIPVISLGETLGCETGAEDQALIITTRSGLVAVAVTEIVDRRQVAVKSLGPILDDAKHLVGGAFLGGGEVLVVVDHHYLGAQARLAERFQGFRPRILVVDDSSGVRQLIAASLRGRGFDVEVAPDAREAVFSMAAQPFDLMVVDYAMPRSNGVELVKALRNSGVTMPIVMVSGVASEEGKAAAWEAGVDAYIDKFDLRRGALVSSITRLIEERARAS